MKHIKNFIHESHNSILQKNQTHKNLIIESHNSILHKLNLKTKNTLDESHNSILQLINSHRIAKVVRITQLSAGRPASLINLMQFSGSLHIVRILEGAGVARQPSHLAWAGRYNGQSMEESKFKVRVFR